MAGAYCFLQGCTVFCSTYPQYGGSVWVNGPQAGLQYGIVQFVAQFPGSGWTVPGYCQTTPPPPQPAPPAPSPPQPVPPPPPPAAGVPEETYPPPAEVPPSECDPSHETAPPSKSIITGGNSSSSSGTKHGFSSKEFFESAQTGSLTAIPKYASAAVTVNHEDPNVANPINFITRPKVVVDKNGSIKIYKPGTSEGYLVFHSPDLESYQLHECKNTNRWPTNISASTFLLHSGIREDGSTGDIANQRLAWGLPSTTRDYPKSGFVFHRPLGDDLEIQATDSAGDLTADCTKLVHFKNSVEIDCDLTVTGTITGDVAVTGVDSWTTIETTTSGGTPYAAALVDDFSAEGTYKIYYNVTGYESSQGDRSSYSWDGMVLYNQPSGTNDLAELGVWYDEIVGASITGTAFTYADDGIGIITLSLQGFADEGECTSWVVKYRIEYVAPGAC